MACHKRLAFWCCLITNRSSFTGAETVIVYSSKNAYGFYGGSMFIMVTVISDLRGGKIIKAATDILQPAKHLK